MEINTTYELRPGQMKLNQMLNLMYGRVNTRVVPNFRLDTSAVVDGEVWYSVSCTGPVGNWIISTQSTELYQEIIDGGFSATMRFDVHEKLYTLLSLRWS